MNISVADVMRGDVIAVREKAGFAEIVSAMRRFHITSVPVIDTQDRVIGTISASGLFLTEDGEEDLGNGHRGLLGLLGRRHDLCRDRETTATDLMSSPVTVTAATPAREAARAMYRHRIQQIPVIDPMTGRLTGVVTRCDLLAVYERPDEDIRREILYDIIERTLGLDPDLFRVSVVGGTVTIGGELERRSAAMRLSKAITHVGGVITVIDQMTYRMDDTMTWMSRARL